jgi:predicted RNA-binding Zn-ribbon protein involved in translation (DUF1610 family)
LRLTNRTEESVIKQQLWIQPPPPSTIQTVIQSNNVKEATIKRAEEKARLICPACRKEAILPSFMGNYIVDYGPPKLHQVTWNCPNCNQSINLKKVGVTEEDIWK